MSDSSDRILKLGTRSSALALWQSNWVATQLRELGFGIELVKISTSGDVKSGPIGAIGSQGVFTKEIQRALLDKEVDFAVHSLKDLPTEDIPGLCLTSVPPRESVGDVLVSNEISSFDEIPADALIGTGSMRRKAQLLNQRPDLQVEDIRGNVDTRLQKLDEGAYQAIILAESGLKRLGLTERITHVIDRGVMIPAVGQGALGIECREEDAYVREVLAHLNDLSTFLCVTAERAMLKALRAGCLAPVGAWGQLKEDQLHLQGVVLSGTGDQRVDSDSQVDLSDQTAAVQVERATALGQAVAESLIAQGATELIAEARENY
ncbi:MAG: hydroxymethylbilane synthase [Pirellulaceae bacterium]|nr:hydroxymethylbilane synthase [Rhodopirellula sp.]MCH2600430.1 hydroxymethylbilane synthase [Pirellulales bacterium]|tara:strand:+ start:5515 stop:6474 length:960 start_codon:yes stop_codon:yes gene_type:complete